MWQRDGISHHEFSLTNDDINYANNICMQNIERCKVKFNVNVQYQVKITALSPIRVENSYGQTYYLIENEWILLNGCQFETECEPSAFIFNKNMDLQANHIGKYEAINASGTVEHIFGNKKQESPLSHQTMKLWVGDSWVRSIGSEAYFYSGDKGVVETGIKGNFGQISFSGYKIANDGLAWFRAHIDWDTIIPIFVSVFIAHFAASLFGKKEEKKTEKD